MVGGLIVEEGIVCDEDDDDHWNNYQYIKDCNGLTVMLCCSL